MLPLKNLLVPKDFSFCAHQALSRGIDLAQRSGATLHTLYAEVLHGDLYIDASRSASHLAESQERLRVLVEEQKSGRLGLAGASLKVVPAVVRDIAPAPAILEYAAEHEIDLIVMGTHGRRGMSRLLLGSVAAEVVRLAPCPVMTVRSRHGDMAPRADVQRVLVPIDFSEHSASALKTAKAFADLYHARMDLLHVVEDRRHPLFYDMDATPLHEVRPSIEEDATENLMHFLEDHIGSVPEAAFHVVSGYAPQAIPEFAAEHEADLIVMSTHGLTGLRLFLMGSVTEKVISTAPCPVLTLKAFHPSSIEQSGVPDMKALTQ